MPKHKKQIPLHKAFKEVRKWEIKNEKKAKAATWQKKARFKKGLKLSKTKRKMQRKNSRAVWQTVI